MGRDKESHKRKHSHRSRHSSPDDSSQSDSSSDYSSSETSASDSESSVEVVKKRRRSSSEHHKGHKKARSEPKKSKKKRSMETKSKKKSKHSGKKPKIVEISEDDYYSKSAEFRTWLFKERGIYFSDLTSEESRKLFRKFVMKWNKGSLGKKYYEGIQSSAIAHDTQSQYKWKFASSVDSGELKSVRDSVSQWSSQGSEVKPAAGPSQPGPSTSGVVGPSIGPSIGPVRGPLLESLHEREERKEDEHARVKMERRAHRKQQELVLDELLPKATTGREAKIEKKKARAEARRARENSPDTNNPYTVGPRDSIQARIRSMQEKRERKASSAVQKISDYKAREKARMDAILEMAKANKKEGAMW